MNLSVDAIGFAGIVFLAASGLLVRYVLPPGSGHHALVWGLDRHQWGAVHFWISLVLLAVLALHLILHWKWIICVARGRPREGSGIRLALGALAALALLVAAVTPLVSPVDRAKSAASRQDRPPAESTGHDAEAVRGRMTLAEIERSTGVPAVFLIDQLGLPSSVSRHSGISKLGKQSGFDIDDVRGAVRRYRRAGQGRI